MGGLLTQAWRSLEDRVRAEFEKSGYERRRRLLHPHGAHAVLRPARRHRGRRAEAGDRVDRRTSRR